MDCSEFDLDHKLNPQSKVQLSLPEGPGNGTAVGSSLGEAKPECREKYPIVGQERRRNDFSRRQVFTDAASRV